MSDKVFSSLLLIGGICFVLFSLYSLISTGCISEVWGEGKGKICGPSAVIGFGGFFLAFIASLWIFLMKKKREKKSEEDPRL